MRLETRPLALLFALLGGMGGCCKSAQAGPPLICHPLEVEEGAELLPWTSTGGFRGTATALTAEGVVAQIAQRDPSPLATLWAECPQDLSALVQRGLAREPSGRPQRLDRFVACLETARHSFEESSATVITPTPKAAPGHRKKKYRGR